MHAKQARKSICHTADQSRPMTSLSGSLVSVYFIVHLPHNIQVHKECMKNTSVMTWKDTELGGEGKNTALLPGYKDSWWQQTKPQNATKDWRTHCWELVLVTPEDPCVLKFLDTEISSCKQTHFCLHLPTQTCSAIMLRQRFGMVILG